MNEFVNRWYQRYIHFVARRAWPILIAGLAVTGVTGWISTNLTVDASYMALLPKTFPSVRNLTQFNEQFGGFAFLLPVIETKDLDAGKRFARDLAARVAKLPEVRFVEYRFPSDFFKRRDLLYLELDDLRDVDRRLREKIKYEKRKANPLYIGLDDEAVNLDFSDIKQKYNRSKRESDYYVSPDRQMLVMLVRPAAQSMDVTFARRLVAAVQKEVDTLNPSSYAADMRVGFTGRFKKQVDEYDVLLNDITRTTAWAGILAWVLLFLYYRTPWILLLMGLPLASGLIWTLAFAMLAIGHLSIITGFLIAVLLGLGMDYVVHFYNRYLEETAIVGAGHAERVLADMTGQVWAMISAALTTAVAFYPLALAEFKGFREFGMIAGTGVMLSLLAFLTIFPALVILAERFKLRLGHRPHFLFPRWAARGLDRPVWVMLGCAGITLGALALAGRLGFEYDMQKLVSPTIPSVHLEIKATRAFNLTFNPSVTLADSLPEAKAVHDVMTTHFRQARGRTTLDAFASIYTFIPTRQEEKLKLIGGLRALVADEALNLVGGKDRAELDKFRAKLKTITRPVRVEDLPESIRHVHFGLPGRGGMFIFLYPNVNQSDMRRVVEFADEMRSLHTAYGPLRITGESVLFADILTMVKRDGLKVLVAALAALCLIVWLDVRHLGTTLAILSPLLAGMTWTLGAAYLAGIKTNFMNLMTIPIVMGIGIDHGVHIYLRYKEEGKLSLPYVLTQTGPSIAVSSTTSMIGFAALLTADYRGLVSMGQMALLGIGLTFLSSVTLYPALLRWLEIRAGHTGSPSTRAK